MAKPKSSKEVTVAARKLAGYDVANLERPAGDRYVNMSTALTRAGHGLTLAEKRLVAMAASKLDSRQPLPAGEVPRTRITALEYAKAFQVDPNTAYEQLQDGAKHLFDRYITFYEPTHKRGGKPIEPTKKQMRWVGQADYQKGEGWVELHWWPSLLPHLVGLNEQFTSYQLRHASALRSSYSWKLLELLACFESTGWAEYSIEDFAVSMDATEKQINDFAAIRRKMIEPAIRELTEKDGWLIQWQAIKAGRKVKTLRFDFVRNPQEKQAERSGRHQAA
jgi:plasmid replication initiation protein